MLRWTWGKPLNQNFSNKYQEGFIETQPDAGIPFRRMRFSDVLDIITVNFALTREDYKRFLSWYKYDTRQGSIPFTYYDCRIDADRTARIIGNPEFNANQTIMQLSITLGLEPITIYKDLLLQINENDYLVVNDSDRLAITIGNRY